MGANIHLRPASGATVIAGDSLSQTVWQVLPDGTRGISSAVGFNPLTGRPIAGAMVTRVASLGSGNAAPSHIHAGPEPQTWALLLSGIGLLLGLPRRRAAA